MSFSLVAIVLPSSLAVLESFPTSSTLGLPSLSNKLEETINEYFLIESNKIFSHSLTSVSVASAIMLSALLSSWSGACMKSIVWKAN